jgi:Sec-independent protein translocase protein TatA
MNFLNLGIGEILFILVIAVIIFGPGNMVKTARDMGAFVRKVAKSPYWQEVWATKRELTELPKLISKEARLDETLSELNKDTQGIKSKFSSTFSDFLKEVNQRSEIDASKEGIESNKEQSSDESAEKKPGVTLSKSTSSQPVETDRNKISSKDSFD